MTSRSVARSLNFDAKVVSPKKLKPLAETLEAKTRDMSEKLTERPLHDKEWTRMKLPTSLGEMGIRAVTSQLEVLHETTKKKTKAHAERIERNLTGKQGNSNEGQEHDGKEMWDGTHNIKHDDRAEAMTGLFKWDLVNASKEHVLAISTAESLVENEHP